MHIYVYRIGCFAPQRRSTVDPLLNLKSQSPMEKKQSGEEQVSSAKAVLLGALAPGVNGATWNTLKFAFLMLGLCLAAMLGLAFSSSDSGLMLHVVLLVLITGALFTLLSRFLAQTGLVSIEHQMQEMGLVPRDEGGIDKKNR